MSVNTSNTKVQNLIGSFAEITKARLSVSVVFSSVAGYLLAAPQVDFYTLFLLCLGGYCMVGASNVYNQIIEKDLDALMERTKMRPLPSGRMTSNAAFILASLLTVIGIAVLYAINPKTALFGAISIFMYVSLYTPLKTKSPLAVFVGAFPGAIPFMLGWVAATGEFGIEPGTLFMIQFFWQFPHFWAIGWFLYDDYERAGFKMLPTGKRDKNTAIQIVLYSVWTVLASLVPASGMTGSLYLSPIAAILVLGLGIWMVYYAIRLYRKRTDKAARQLMLVSVSYITLLQVIFVVDKFVR
ncbi:heme o synthase [Aureitalea marina]|uniref:Protoheme IX farnesyltransferase n=1 Tax=Aureitalea marina TaxID=930804 RepID=A0A2S7KR85_9FLAO|nr:heme o synthase [Aureitalea marina]PQB05139.1 protoheme IX farnesyltransferase [Aureitalea marina]